jgi:hypothetical protein
MDWRYWLAPAASWAIPVAYILLRGIRSPRPGQVLEWADSYGLMMTDANRPMVERYLRRTKRYRTVGAVAGLIFSVFILAATEGRASNTLWTNGLITAAAGYLLGAVAAEATLSRPARSAPRAALLELRTLGHYLPGYAIWAQRILPALSVGLVLLLAGLDVQPSSAAASVLAFAELAALTVLLAGGLELVERLIVRRAQPLAAPELMLADEAIRSSSIHALAGAGIALLLVGLSYQLSRLVTATNGPLSSVLGFLSILALLLAFSSWIDLGHPKSWRLRRATWQESRA